VKSPIKARRKRGILLREMDKIRRTLSLEGMTSVPKAASNSRIGIFLPGKQEHEVPLFIANWDPVGEGILLDRPSQIQS
jgi:hypothetical protein